MSTPRPQHEFAGRLAVALALALGLSAAQAQTGAATARTETAPAIPNTAASPHGNAASAAAAAVRSRVARGDRKFVEDAAASGTAEVMLGKLAQQRAASAEVKQYAERMVADHTKANDELMALAGPKGVALPPLPTPAQQRMHDSMAKLDGAAFDKLYMSHMLGDHRKAVSLFQKQSRAGQDAELKAFAAKTLPTLQEHLKMATALHDSVKKSR